MKWIFCLSLIFSSLVSSAQVRKAPRSAERPTLTYDLGISTGSYNGVSYNEINLGLNWHLNNFLTWRNAMFSRMGTGEVAASGLDTSLRLDYNYLNANSNFGLNVFGGPGYRISKKEQSAAFLEGGVKVKAGGLSIGAGLKVLQYSNPGSNADGTARPKQDTTMFLILAGGGAF
jgi:hypothetical protein